MVVVVVIVRVIAVVVVVVVVDFLVKFNVEYPRHSTDKTYENKIFVSLNRLEIYVNLQLLHSLCTMSQSVIIDELRYYIWLDPNFPEHNWRPELTPNFEDFPKFCYIH